MLVRSILIIAIYVAFAYVVSNTTFYTCMFDGCRGVSTIYVVYSILAFLGVSVAALVSLPFALRAKGAKRIALLAWPLIFFLVSPLVQPMVGGDPKLDYPAPWSFLGLAIVTLGGPIGALAMTYAIPPRWR